MTSIPRLPHLCPSRFHRPHRLGLLRPAKHPGICSFVVFFSVVISLLRTFGVLSALSELLSLLLAPLGITPEWATRLLTGLLEVSSGVWSLSGAGTLSGKLSMAAFMLGWAGLSVHCQVLSFLSESGLSMGTYLTGKFLHAVFSAGLTVCTALCSVFSFVSEVGKC